MASPNQLTTRTMHHLAKSLPARALPQAIHMPSRTYHSTLHPLRLKQTLNNTSHSSFHTSPSPSIDSFTIPQSYAPPTPSTDILRIPLLPTNSFAAHAEATAEETLPKPEIHTLSADGTHFASPSFLSGEKDGHHGAVEGFDVVGSMERGVEAVEREAGVVRELWEGLLDDVLGKKKVGGA